MLDLVSVDRVTAEGACVRTDRINVTHELLGLAKSWAAKPVEIQRTLLDRLGRKIAVTRCTADLCRVTNNRGKSRERWRLWRRLIGLVSVCKRPANPLRILVEDWRRVCGFTRAWLSMGRIQRKLGNNKSVQRADAFSKVVLTRNNVSALPGTSWKSLTTSREYSGIALMISCKAAGSLIS